MCSFGLIWHLLIKRKKKEASEESRIRIIMPQENSKMERIRADLLRRARTDRQRDENETRNGWIEQETGNNHSQSTAEESNAEPPRTRAAFPRCLIASRRYHHSNSDGETPKSPTAPPRPATLSSSRYGETAPPSSLPSPIPLSHMPDSPSPHPRGPPTEFGPDASNPFPRPADHLIDGSPYQHSLPDQPATDMESGRKPRSKRLMLCFPLAQSRRIRSQGLTCFVSGVFLASLLAVCKFVHPPAQKEIMLGFTCLHQVSTRHRVTNCLSLIKM